MLSELRASNPDLNIEILGVNMLNDAVFNPLIVAERKLPWLQETEEANVWYRWGVTWRDVRIVDSQGRLQAVYNLTSHDLTDEQNRATLKQLFLNAAKIVDSDGDHLPDDWELKYFGNFFATAEPDSDHDGYNNFTEYAFGTNPTDPNSRPLITPKIVSGVQSPLLNLTLRRRAGAFLDYSIDASPGLQEWSAKSALVPAQEPRNLFDGSGTMEAVYSVPVGAPEMYLRLRVFSRP